MSLNWRLELVYLLCWHLFETLICYCITLVLTTYLFVCLFLSIITENPFFKYLVLFILFYFNMFVMKKAPQDDISCTSNGGAPSGMLYPVLKQEYSSECAKDLFWDVVNDTQLHMHIASEMQHCVISVTLWKYQCRKKSYL